MAVACGSMHTAAVTEDGEVWTWGFGKEGRLGVHPVPGGKHSRRLPVRVGGENELGGARAVMLAAGNRHTAVVASDGAVWTWGSAESLGHGDREHQLTPTRLGPVKFYGFRAAMVSCGGFHTVVLAGGLVWTFGMGKEGQLGHGDRVKLRSVPAPVSSIKETIVMVAGGGFHTLAVSAEGKVYSWGSGADGQLGTGNTKHCLLPARLKGRHFGGVRVL